MNETLFHDTLRWARLGALLGSVLWMTACGGGGSGGAPPAATPAPSVVALFAGPSGVATDSLGNVYVADGNNHTIRKVACHLQQTAFGRPSFKRTIKVAGTSSMSKRTPQVARIVGIP